MVDFSVKAQALKLASIIGVCDSGSKAFFMFKYFFGSRLATFRSEWSLLTDNSSPSTILLLHMSKGLDQSSQNSFP